LKMLRAMPAKQRLIGLNCGIRNSGRRFRVFPMTQSKREMLYPFVFTRILFRNPVPTFRDAL
jgi:hypothetical protein